MAEAKNPGIFEITTASPFSGRTVVTEKEFGDKLSDKTALFGEDVINSIVERQLVIMAQGVVRAKLDAVDAESKKIIDEAKAKGKNKMSVKDKMTFIYSEEDAKAALEAWKPGVQRTGGGGKKKDPVADLVARIKSGEISKEEVNKLIEQRLAQQ